MTREELGNAVAAKVDEIRDLVGAYMEQIGEHRAMRVSVSTTLNDQYLSAWAVVDDDDNDKFLFDYYRSEIGRVDHKFIDYKFLGENVNE